MSLQADEKRRLAGSFGGFAEEYDRGRPGYPAAAIAWLLGSAPLDVLDLAAGTGKLTRGVIAAGHHVTAVEPLDGMRAVLERTAPEARILAGKAEEIPLADASVDAVVVGGAFHWFDQEAALAEIARVLRPPGTLGILWRAAAESESWVSALPHVTPGGGRIQSPEDLRAQLQRLESRFATVQERDFEDEQLLDREGLRDLALSRSTLAVRAQGERETVLEQIERAWEENAAGRDAVTLRWRTRVIRSRDLPRGS